MFATPYQVRTRRRPRDSSRRSSTISEDDILQDARPAVGLRLRGPQGRPDDRRAGANARPRRDRDAAGEPARLPGGQARRPGDRHGRRRRPGADRARGRRGRRPAAAPTASARWCVDGLGKEIERNTITGAAARARHAAHARRRHPGADREVLAASARPTSRRARPRSSWTRATREILAMANWPTVDPSDPAGATRRTLQNMATGLHLRARLDLQGVHRRRGAPGAAGHARAPRSTCRPRSRWPTGRSRSRAARAETPHGRPDPRPVLERRRGDDRPRARRPATSTTGSASSASASRPGSTSRARSRASCRRRREFSGSTMGNLPIGQGLSVTPMQMAAAYSAIADGGILRAPQLVLDEDGHRVAEPNGHRVISSKSAAQIRTDARGRARARRHRLRGQRARLHARRQDGNRPGGRDGTYSETKFVASFVGFAPAQDPKLLVAIMVDEPSQGELLRRHRRGPGVRRDREVRPALPGDSAGPGNQPLVLPAEDTIAFGGTIAASLRHRPWHCRQQSLRPLPCQPPTALASRDRAPAGSTDDHTIAVMKLRELILGMDFAGVEGDEDTDVASLAYDSRRVAPGALFFCVRGQRPTATTSLPTAVERGRRGAGRRAPPRARPFPR